METRVARDPSTGTAPMWVQTEEDPETTIKALGPRITGTILCISSGGCTPLALAAAGAEEVIAVDIDPAQIAISELKLCSIQALSQCEFENMWFSSDVDCIWKYYDALANRLSLQTRSILAPWLQHSDHRPLIERGLMQGVGSDLKASAPEMYESLQGWFRTSSMREQWEYYGSRLHGIENIIASMRHARAERCFGSGSSTHSPESVKREMELRFARRFRHLVGNIRVRGNPFAAQLLLGEYLDDAKPVYLHEMTYRQLQSLIGRIKLVCSDVLDMVQSLSPRSLAGADLSNITDLLPNTEVDDLFDALARALCPGGVVVHRNLVWDEPYDATGDFVRHTELSSRLTTEDRSFVYSAITVDERKP